MQGKFIGNGSVDAEPLREVLSSWIQLRDLVRLQEVGNLKLKRKLSEVSKALEDDYEIEFELITTGILTEAAQKDLATFQTQLVDLSENNEFYASLKVIDSNKLKRRYDMALEKDNPSINHKIDLSKSKAMEVEISGNKVVITAICNKLTLKNNLLSLQGFSVVNGCQSLTTILNCSEKVKQLEETYILFRFYEIPQRERGDKISINTNFQSAVKPRDLRSNDKRVLNIKKSYEQKYPSGCFITKRGEVPLASKDKDFVLDLVDLGKYLISWHSQRPNIAYSETKIFDKYFEQLFKKDYSPEKAQALNVWMTKIWNKWTKDNPLGLNESLLAMRAYAPYHHLYAISVCFGVSNSMPMESVPDPSVTINRVLEGNLIDQIVDLAGRSLSFALESAVNEPQPSNRVFSPQNWIKTKSCLAGIRAAVSQSLNMLPMMNAEIANKIKQSLKMERDQFEARWSAD